MGGYLSILPIDRRQFFSSLGMVNQRGIKERRMQLDVACAAKPFGDGALGQN